ncbi:MAG: PEP-CTERM sorting domain-containing protein [Verrucomicrobiia bacterium]|jgi:hypothetical protein
MKARLFLAWFAVFSLSVVFTRSQTLVTFDDFNLAQDQFFQTNIPDGYEGLSWSNFWVLNAVLRSNIYGFLNGYNYGMVSASNVAFNAAGNPAEIDSVTNFNFLSAYLTGAWNSNLNIEIEGFNGAQEIYDTIVVASATNATLFTFNYLNIDRLYFNSYGGQDAGFAGGSGEQFAMDNFMFEFIPEPSSLLLTALGAVALCAFLKRRRA